MVDSLRLLYTTPLELKINNRAQIVSPQNYFPSPQINFAIQAGPSTNY